MIMATYLVAVREILYLLTDIAYTMIDPRVRLGANHSLNLPFEYL